MRQFYDHFSILSAAYHRLKTGFVQQPGRSLQLEYPQKPQIAHIRNDALRVRKFPGRAGGTNAIKFEH
jgi:hypothetical protein